MSRTDRSHPDAGGQPTAATITTTDASELTEAEIARAVRRDASDDLRSLVETD